MSVKSDSERLRQLIITNATSFDFVDDISSVSISIEELAPQNVHSSRAGGTLELRFNTPNGVVSHVLWMKRVEYPERAYTAIHDVFERMKSHGCEAPVPKPYFYDREGGLLIMDKVSGSELLRLTLRYCLPGGRQTASCLPDLFEHLGNWLARYQKAVQVESDEDYPSIFMRIREGLTQTDLFTNAEKGVLASHLDHLEKDPVFENQPVFVIPYNAFTMRNVMIKPDHSFYLIDWDSMVSSEFPPKNLCWWDLLTMWLNLQGLMRFSPVTSRQRVRELCDSLVHGYVKNNPLASNTSVEAFHSKIAYVLALKYYIGLDSDRPMAVIYKRNLGWRYANKLRRRFLEGSASLV